MKLVTFASKISSLLSLHISTGPKLGDIMRVRAPPYDLKAPRRGGEWSVEESLRFVGVKCLRHETAIFVTDPSNDPIKSGQIIMTSQDLTVKCREIPWNLGWWNPEKHRLIHTYTYIYIYIYPTINKQLAICPRDFFNSATHWGTPREMAIQIWWRWKKKMENMLAMKVMMLMLF